MKDLPMFGFAVGVLDLRLFKFVIGVLLIFMSGAISNEEGGFTALVITTLLVGIGMIALWAVDIMRDEPIVSDSDLDQDEMRALAKAERYGSWNLSLSRRRDIIRLFKFFVDHEIDVPSFCNELGRYAKTEIDAAREDFYDMGVDHWTQRNIREW